MALGSVRLVCRARAAGLGSGVESTRVSRLLLLQQDAAQSPRTFETKCAPRFDFSRLANASVRCQAATSTIARHVSIYGDGVLEREMSRRVEDTYRANPSTFEADAAVGRVECTGKGCRPVFEEATSFLSMSYCVDEDNRQVGAKFPSYSSDFQIKIHPRGCGWQGRALNQSASAATRSFEVALQDFPHDSQHLSDFAVFSWKSLGDTDKAEELYQEALGAAPDDTNILASYANFLWQCDES